MPLLSQALLQPKPCLACLTFLAPSFSAFFLASSKSSFWPMLACGAEKASKLRAERIVRPLGVPGWPATNHK